MAKIYGGVRLDAESFDEYHIGEWMGWIYIIDFPFSLVLDTALLPVTVVWELIRAVSSDGGEGG